MPNHPWTITLLSLGEQANANGTVPYHLALAAAEIFGIRDAFERLYGDFSQWGNMGIDAGEFADWALSLPY